MIEELQARFLPQFVAQARRRIDKVCGIVARNDLGSLTEAVRDLHALAGEAGLLGLERMIELARTAEKTAQRLVETRTADDATALKAALDELGKGLELVTPSTAGEKSP